MTGILRSRQEPFSVTIEQRGHGAYLRLTGEIDIATVPIIERCLRTAESNGNTAIVFDLEAVTFMDCSGLSVFLGAAERASESGRTFGIVKASASVERVLQITKATHLLVAPDIGGVAGQAPPRSPELGAPHEPGLLGPVDVGFEFPTA